ncbi:hypothetical protein HU200_029189 [Digitaria exilis]|uniref:Uncharacterized protein n=1 Tax=Digitaria exilis TaxID=1010633 RepID=A0A835ERS6_9POAL|nr:hypothetical protein HU200_029189 [Digitaria exilis]
MPDVGCFTSRGCFSLFVGDKGSSFGYRSAACSRPRRLVLLCNYQFGAGQRPRIALAATATRDDLACSGLWQVVQHGWTHLVRHIGCGWRKRRPWSASLTAAA